MEMQEALKIMRALANGVNPQTGEALEADSVCRQPETVKSFEPRVRSARPTGAAGAGSAGQRGQDVDSNRRCASLRRSTARHRLPRNRQDS
jgi:hypothetical protein